MNKLLLLILTSIIYISIGNTQDVKTQSSQTENDENLFRIMFYNVENLFDTFDDTLKKDDQFLPNGDKNWSKYKYKDKLSHISKVVVGVGKWHIPDIIGLCETENRFVLDELTQKSPLAKLNYKIIHQESPDRRGIDVGLLYQENNFKIINWKAIPIHFNFKKKYKSKTRDILYVCGETKQKDTLHIFVNHWPSRWGGQFESEPNRFFVASVLRKQIDSLFQIDKNSNIVIIGDLNDEPENTSVKKILNAKLNYEIFEDSTLYNLSGYLQQKGKASHKYQGEWGMLDHIIVSSALLNHTKNIYTTLNNAHVYKPDFLLEKDNKYIGYKPFRTFTGFKYNGGYSDHLPVYLDIYHEKK